MSFLIGRLHCLHYYHDDVHPMTCAVTAGFLSVLTAESLSEMQTVSFSLTHPALECDLVAGGRDAEPSTREGFACPIRAFFIYLDSLGGHFLLGVRSSSRSSGSAAIGAATAPALASNSHPRTVSS